MSTILEEGIVSVPGDNGKFNVDESMQWKVEGDKSSIGQPGSRSLSISSEDVGQSKLGSSKWKPKSFPPKCLSYYRLVS